MLLHSSPLALAVCLTSSTPCLASVWTVGGTSPTHGTIQAAVDSSAEGDVVLVRAAPNGDVLVSGRGVAIVADVPERLTWTGRLRIENVPAGSCVVVCGFTLGLTSVTPITVTQCAGAIRIQDCGIYPASAPPLGGARFALDATSCADVAILRSTLRAPPPNAPPFDGLGGYTCMRATGSTLAIQDSEIRGGSGRDGYYPSGPSGTPGGTGGYGILLDASTLVLQSATVAGGNGGHGVNGSCTYPIHPTAGGSGGTGIVLRNGSSARAIAGRTLGGVGGQGGANECEQAAAGAHGVPVVVENGTWGRVAGPDRSFLAPRIVRVGQALSLTFAGDPFETAYLAYSSAAAHVDSAVLDGVLLLAGPIRRVRVGTLDAQGTRTIAPFTPALPAGATNDLMHLQPVLFDAAGGTHVGCAGVVVRLDALH